MLLYLFVVVPLFNLAWFVTEIILSVKRFKHRSRAVSFLMPLMAGFFLMESVAIDLYLLSQMRM